MENYINLRINLNKLYGFLYLLKIEINMAIYNDELFDSEDCLEYIKECINNSDNIFNSLTNDNVDDMARQIFLYLYGDNDNELAVPLFGLINDISQKN